ncbi:retinol dehydrogenase 14 [Halyomorpha halys]|uniref:retinol dehydrogenase 14 n=1 Tax=Halyomorpha halys TaxID=286706 RepID=UPI0006D4DB0F|nr:retinol dehydrogenase 14 [Halyomorpha halys]
MWILEDWCYHVTAGGTLLSLFLVLAAKLYLSITCGVCFSKKDMNGKTVIVTGANSGIGMETTLDLAKRGARVIMACRNMIEATKVRNTIAREAKNDNVVVRKLDLSSVQSIREFATEINWREPRLDVLIHNAGTANTFTKMVTEDGFEMTMMTNMFGPFLLTHLLIDLLKKSAPSRIVTVASELYRLAKVNLDNPNPVNSLPAYLYYSSKYANILFSLELAHRLQGTGVTANCLHPGLIDSGIWRNVPCPLNIPLKIIAKLFFKTPEEGAQTTIHLAISDEVNEANGKYFMDCKEHGLASDVSDMGKAAKYWEKIEALILKPTDPRI